MVAFYLSDNCKQVPSAFNRFMALSAEMLPLADNKLLFWVDDMAILDTQTMNWELVEIEDIMKPDTFTHIIGSKIFAFSASERSFHCLEIGQWEWKRWEVPSLVVILLTIKTPDDVISVWTLSTARRVYSAAVGTNIYIWCNNEPTIYVYNAITDTWSSTEPSGRIPSFEQYSCTTVGNQVSFHPTLPLQCRFLPLVGGTIESSKTMCFALTLKRWFGTGLM